MALRFGPPTLLAAACIAGCSPQPEGAGPQAAETPGKPAEAVEPPQPEPPLPPAPASPEAHAELADRGLDLLRSLTETVEGLASGGLTKPAAQARLGEAKPAIETLRAERLALVPPNEATAIEAIRAVYAEREPLRGELFRRFNAASRQLRASPQFLMEAQLSAIQLMKALQIQAE